MLSLAIANGLPFAQNLIEKRGRIMLVSKYLDSIEGTEKEPVFLNSLVELADDKDIEKLLNMPIIGNLLSALVALGSSDSIEVFKQTEHYKNIKDWGITVFNLEKGYISIHPGPKHVKKILVVIAVICVGVYLFKIRKKNNLFVS